MEHFVSIDEIIKDKIPSIGARVWQQQVLVKPSSSAFWEFANEKIEMLCQQLKVEDISQMPGISSARKAYKMAGKDPARYRLSAEALLRRVVKGNDLYRVSNVVDCINLTSLQTGVSIGGYDTSKIVGDIRLSLGQEGEPYEAIGRGELNMEGMPAFRDDLGLFGSMTSDSVRTSVSEQTKNFTMLIIDFGPKEKVDEAVELLKSYLSAYCGE